MPVTHTPIDEEIWQIQFMNECRTNVEHARLRLCKFQDGTDRFLDADDDAVATADANRRAAVIDGLASVFD